MSATETLERIARLAPEAVGYMQRHGFVLDRLGPLEEDASELDRWKVLAFSLYTDLVQAGVLAEAELEA